VSFAFWILSSRWRSTNGPFLIERPIDQIRLGFSINRASSIELHGPAVSANENEPVRVFLVPPGLAALGDFAPRRCELLPAAAGFGLALAAAVRMVHRVPRHPAIDR